MTNQKSNGRQSSGPAPVKRSNFTLVAVIVAIAFIVIQQMTNGGLGNWLGGSQNGSQANPTSFSIMVTVAAMPSATAQSVAQATPSAQETTAAAAPATVSQAKPTARASETPRPTATSPPAARASDLPVIYYDDLPPEAQETIALIDQGGPFPYSRDGITFQNRERILPRQPEGYYREYTVITPGSNDRGARRIVLGEEGEVYYTDDHYDSFSEVGH